MDYFTEFEKISIYRLENEKWSKEVHLEQGSPVSHTSTSKHGSCLAVGGAWAAAAAGGLKNFSKISPLILHDHPTHHKSPTWNTSIVVAPSKRNILTQTRVDIGSTQV